MKKNVMLSLVAMTSVPMATYANADLTNTVDKAVEEMQPGDGLSIQDGVFVSTGTPVELTIGKLVKGEYKLTASTIGTNVKLTVNGKELTNNVFNLTGEETVAIKAESSDGNGFSVGGFKLELVYDFSAAYTKLNTALSTAYNSIDASTTDFWERELLKQYNEELASKIETIKDGDEKAYDVYVAEKLYEDDINNSEIGKVVNKFVADVASAKENASANTYAGQQITTLKEKLAELNSLLNDDVRNMFTQKIDDISTEITTFEKDVEAAYTGKTAASEFSKENVDNKVKEITDEINKVSEDIGVAKTNFTAYTDVKALVDEAETKYNETFQSLIKTLAGDIYATMLQEAQGKLREQNSIINDVKALNGTTTPASTAAEKQEENTTAINGVIKEIGEIESYYTTKYTGLEAAYKTLDEEVKAYETNLTERKKQLQDDIKTTAHDKEIAAVEAAIAELRAMVENAHADYTVDALGTSKAYTDKKADVDTKWNALTAASDKTVNNYNTNTTVTASIAALEEALADANAEVAKCVSDDKKFNGATAWNKTATDLEKAIKKYSDDAAAAYKAGTSVAYQQENADAITATGEAITDYQSEVENAFADYKEVAKAIADNSTALDKVKTFVGNDGAVTDASGQSYTEKISGIQARIDALQTSLDNAMKKQDGELATALAAISVDASISSDIAAITEEQFKADKEKYEGTINVDAAKSQLAYQTNRQTEISERIAKFKTDNDQDALGNSYSEIYETLTAIETEFKEVVIPSDEITSENAGEIRTKLVEVNAAFNEVVAKLDALDEEVEPIKAAVKANNDQKDAADKRVAELKSTTEKDKVDIEDIKGNNEDSSRDAEFAKLYDEVSKLIEEQEGAIDKSYKAETLVADWATISAKLDEIEGKIKDYADQATASTKNMNAKDKQNDLVTNAGFDALIATAKAEVEKVATGAGQDYFLDVLDIIKNNDIATLTENITKQYEAGGSVDYTATVNNEIVTIKAKISVVPENAKNNEAAHNAQLEAKDDTQDKWNEVFAYLSAEDKSSQLQGYLNRLTEIQVEINDLNAKVEEAFGKGESAESTFVTDYGTLSGEITKISKQRDEGYDKAIEADNIDRYDKFVSAIGETQAKYNEVVNSIAKFSGVSNEYFAGKINAILDANKSLYEYPEKIRTLTAKAVTEYGNTVSPALYDEKEVNTEAAKTLKTEIEAIYNDFTTSANAAALEALNEKIEEAETTLNNALATLDGYSDNVKKNAFSDIRDIITDAKASAAGDKELAVNISGILNDLDRIETEKLVSTGQETAAEAEYAVVIGDIDTKIAADRAELEDFVFAEINTTDYLKEYNDAVELYIEGEKGAKNIGEAAVKAKNMFGDNLAAVKKLIEDFKANNKYDEAKTAAKANETSLKSWEKMTAELDKLQTKLNEAKTYADEYFAPAAQNAVEGVQSDVDNLRKKADDAKKLGTANEVETAVLEGCETIAGDIANLNALADDAESAALTNAIEELKIEYNQAVAAAGSDNEDVTAYEATIEGYSTELEGINSKDFKGDKHASYIALEKKIALTRTELANFYDKALAGNTYNSLIALIDKIKTKQAAEVTGLDACNVVVKEKYASVLEEILKKAQAAEADVEAAKEENTVLFYNDNLKTEITAIAKELTDIATAIDEMQAPYTANDEAYARLTAELDVLQKAYEALAEKLAGYTHLTKEDLDDFATTAKANITDKIDEDRKTVEEAHNATELGKMLTADSQLSNKGDVETWLASLDKNNSKTETTGRIETVKAALAEAKLAIEGGKFTDRDELDKQVEAIEAAIKPLETYNTDAFNGLINKDIDGNALVGEDGKEVSSKKIKFVEEAVPAIFAKVTELNEAISKLEQDTEDNCYILGDVSRDGYVLVDDYTTICNVVLEKETLEEGSVRFLAADAHEDGVINIGDVTAVVRIIKNAGSTVAKSYAKARRASSAVTKTNDVISLTSEGEGTKRRIVINLQNSKAYNACQMDIKLPAGLTLAGEDAGTRASGLTLMSNDLANGTHRIMLSSLDETEITEGAGAVIYLDVEVGYSYSGEDIVVSDVLFTDSSARLYSANGTGGDGTTGINTITVGEAVKGKIYSVGGKLMNGLKRGVNIIRGNDGSTKKVIVK